MLDCKTRQRSVRIESAESVIPVEVAIYPVLFRHAFWPRGTQHSYYSAECPFCTPGRNVSSMFVKGASMRYYCVNCGKIGDVAIYDRNRSRFARILS